MALQAGINKTISALETHYSAIAVEELRRRVVLLNATDRTWDGEGTYTDAAIIRVPDEHTDSVEETDIDFRDAAKRAKADRAWDDGNNITSAQVILTQNREVRKTSIISRLDAAQSTINELDKERQEQVGELARKKEDILTTYIAGLATHTTVLPASADYPKADGTGANGNGGKVFTQTYGTAGSITIGTNGVPKGTGASAFPTEILKRGRIVMARNNYLRGGGITSMEDRSDMVYAFMAPEIAQILLDDLEKNRNFSQTLTENVLGLDDNGQRFNGTNTYEGTYRGIHIMTSTSPALGGGGQDVPWPIWILSGKAIAWTDGPVLTQILTPSTGEIAPVFKLRQLQEVGCQLVQRAAILKFNILQK